MARAPVRALVLLAAAAMLPGCGGSGGRGPGIDGLAPSTFYAEVAAPLLVKGSGFGSPGPATVRLTATAGTPFLGGTAAFVDLPGTVVDDATVALTSPLATLCPSAAVPVAVRVTLADATVYDSAGPVATLAGPALSAFSPTPVPATVATPFAITGSGFGPVGGAANLVFTTSAGTPFLGGTSATAAVAGTVASPQSITGMTPVAVPGPDFGVTVTATFAQGSCVTSAATFAAFEANAAPVVSSTAPSDLLLGLGDRVSFTVTATDAEGDLVSLRLLNPPAGATFRPISGAASPASGTIEWVVGAWDDPGPVALLFRAHDDVNPSKTRTLSVWMHVSPGTARTARFGDVTGDGKPDVVALARNADAAGVPDAGEIYVWAGGASPSGTPVASLRVGGATAGDQLGEGGLRLADVSGDGILDVVAATDLADYGLTQDYGEICVWNGGGGLVGVRTPDALLRAGAIGDRTGLAGDPLRWQVGDVTGDGTPDIVAAAPFADRGAVDTGIVYVWRGGPSLAGFAAWDIELLGSPSLAGDAVGSGGILLGDLTGDGVLDVLASAPSADTGVGTADAGVLLLWQPSLVPPGSPATRSADAVMRASGAAAGERLGADAAATVRIEDVSGDGIPDVVAPSPRANRSAVQSGAVYLWRGGPTLAGTVPQDATLEVASAAAGDALGAGAAGRVLLGDLTGDGVSDVVGVATAADLGAVVNAGAVYLWRGGATLAGTRQPTAVMTLPSPAAGDTMGSGGTRLADLTDDGVLDLVSAAPLADFGGFFDAGTVGVWAGGAGLSGSVAPTAVLRAASASNDRLAYEAREVAFASRFGDITGDGALDIVVPAFQADPNLVVDAGAVYLWRGGAGLAGSPTPHATLAVPGASWGDRLGSSSGASVALADVSGDGAWDVVAAASSADLAGAANAGAIYAWRGGPGLSGSKAPTATLRDATPRQNDQLAGGLAAGVAWDLADANGDGVLDLVAVACLADVSGATDAGSGYFWAGGASLAGTRTPTATLPAPAGGNGDRLGASGATTDLLFVADLTDDAVPDILVGGSSYTGSGPNERGGLFLWKGSASLAGGPAPAASLLAPAPAALDRLGN